MSKLEQEMRLEGSAFLTRYRSHPKRLLTVLETSEDWELYGILLEIQFDYTLSDELRFMINQPGWLEAKIVLELGCGPGHFLRHLKRFFPKKRYLGIDLSKDFILAAKKRMRGIAGVKFEMQNVYDTNLAPYDYIICRAVLQHLPDLDKFLEMTSQGLSPTGSLLILDAADSLDLEIPAIPLLKKLSTRRETSQKIKGGNRQVIQDLEAKLPYYKLKIVAREHAAIPAISEDRKLAFVKMMLCTYEFIRRQYDMDVDRLKLIQEMFCWLSLPGAYVQKGESRLIIKKL